MSNTDSKTGVIGAVSMFASVAPKSTAARRIEAAAAAGLVRTGAASPAYGTVPAARTFTGGEAWDFVMNGGAAVEGRRLALTTPRSIITPSQLRALRALAGE